MKCYNRACSANLSGECAYRHRDNCPDVISFALAAPETQLVDADAIRAQAWRDALDEVITMAVSNEQQVQNRHWKDAHKHLIAHSTELRDSVKAARQAVDVDGLAKAFEYVLQMRSHLCDDPELPKVARDLAETAVEFIGKNGGR